MRTHTGQPDTAALCVDALVVGAGGCGLTAALAAHDAGLVVAIAEKSHTPGGNTTLSSGSIPAAGTELQRAAGIADSAEAFAEDLRAAAGPHDAEPLVDRLAGVSADLIDFLMALGVTLDLITGYRHVGHRTHRLHAPPAKRGADLVADLVRAVTRKGIPLAVGQGTTDLLTEAGRVVGAICGGDRIAARAVILACNGFGAAPDLLTTHCPAVARATYSGAPGSTGDALRWGAALGAATGNLGAYQGHAGLSSKTGALMTWTLVERGAVIVDRHGRRFGDETLGYSAFADLALAADGPFHMIYDTCIRDNVAAGQPDYPESLKMGAARTFETPQAMAEGLGLAPEVFTETLDQARSAATGACEDRFGRGDWGFGPLARPLCATEIEPALFHTQGGLKIDPEARVLDRSGRPILGLYAGATAPPSS